MDREFLIDLLAPFGPVTIRRMFSGFGISADGVNFAMVIQGAIYLRADVQSIARFEAERMAPFKYATRTRQVTVGSYWRLPDRLLDDPDELAEWAHQAFGAAERAALAKAGRTRRAAAKKAASTPANQRAAKPPAAKAAKQTKASGKKSVRGRR
jgi:DNA transformation protein and related proteins